MAARELAARMQEWFGVPYCMCTPYLPGLVTLERPENAEILARAGCLLALKRKFFVFLRRISSSVQHARLLVKKSWFWEGEGGGLRGGDTA